MDEKKKPTEEKKPTEGEETPSEHTNILEDARTERKLMDEQLERRERLIEREEAIAAANTLGGQSEAGQEPIKQKEESPKEYRQRVDKELREGTFNDSNSG